MNTSDFKHLMLVLVATLTLAGLFYFPYWSVRSKTIESFIQEQRLLAGQAIEGLDAYFSTYEKALGYLTKQEGIIDLDDSGRVLLQDFLTLHDDDISAICRIDLRGRMVFLAPGDIPAQGADVSELDFFRQAKQTGKPLISEVFTSWEGKDVITFAYPVFKQGRFDGLLTFHIPYARITARYVESIRLKEGAEAMLISRGGVTLYSPVRQQIGEELRSLLPDGPTTGEIMGQMRAGKEGNASFVLTHQDTGRRETRYAVYMPVALPGGSFWSILIASPENDVLQTITRFRQLWLLVTIIVTLTVGVLTFILSSIISRGREEKRQRAVEEQLGRVLDHAPMGVILSDRTGRIRYANKAVLEQVDTEESAVVVGHKLEEFIHPDFKALLNRPRTTDSPEEVHHIRDLKLITRSGRILDLEITETRLPWSSDMRYLSILRDVTEERRAAEHQRRLVTAIEQVKESVVITNQDGTIEYVNAAFCAMTGYSREEAIDRKASILWAGKHDPAFYRQIDKTLNRGEVWQGRVINRRKNGELITVATTISPVRSITGVVTHFVTVKRDITQEEAFEHRLRQAQKMEAIGTLAGGIAHDFNNILGAIIGFTDMTMLQSDPSSDIYENLTHIRQGGKRAADLVQQILTFSRQSTADKSPVIIAPLIKESLKLLRASLPATIVISQRISNAPLRVLAAPVQIQQIVMNLCTNAFYAMREQGGTLTVRLEQGSSEECERLGPAGNKGCVRLDVSDTGTGMDALIMERIFTPFFTTKSPGEGTGMGLSVVHGIVEDLHGRIFVESAVGQGATFTLLLPVEDGESEEEQVLSPTSLKQGTEHILVIDDEQDIRQTCRLMLTHLGYTVTATGEPDELLAIVAEGHVPVDLVLTDQTMPKMTGIELIARLKQLRSDLPVILCTGYSDRLNNAAALQAGACRLLMKPMDLQALSEAVRQALDGGSFPDGSGV